jgi:tRNA/tmRNA/rRNA uracil-C5-methylase (TrmA/RlmC/RlmD family)
VIVEVAAVGHGGICIAHAPDGRAILVRHALPGEQVRIEITEERSSYLRADAIEVLRASPHRVTPPCPFSGPGRCGGCDWQHADLAEQRRLKAAVVAEQLRRIARLDREVVVEPVVGDADGLGWRTRMRLAVGPDGRAGLHRYRSTEIEPITECLIAHESLPVASVVSEAWPDMAAVDLVAADLVTAAGRDWRIPEGGFWQVHPGAPDALVDAVLALLDIAAADICVDLYAGVGLFAGALAPLVPDGEVLAVENSVDATTAARANLADLGNVTVVNDRVDRWLKRATDGADIVILDPPRKGAGTKVVASITALGPRQVVYVACDPASLARDVAAFGAHGWELASLRAFDMFPMTHHVECVALITPPRPAPAV